LTPRWQTLGEQQNWQRGQARSFRLTDSAQG
jgi:hypothetical protein